MVDKECAKCIHAAVCETAKACGGYVSGCKHFKEQKKGMCNFCKKPIYIKAVQNTMPILAPMTRAEELRQELINLTGKVYLQLQNKYCPICGADMRGAEYENNT